MDIHLTTEQGALRQHWDLPSGQSWSSSQWREVFLAFDPATLQSDDDGRLVMVQAISLPDGVTRAVTYDPARSWYRINLDGVPPIVPEGTEPERHNEAIERVKLVLNNPTARQRTARLLFAKSQKGIGHRFGVPITGISAVLRDTDGHPTGIPVQLSKNWHNRPEGGVYAGQWFHGFSQVHLPPGAEVELELTLAYGHWGGVAAASHAQLCLIGWGSNQLWNQSAIGAWGESICYEPDQVQAQATVLDVRPLMVGSMNNNQKWSWTHNVGGGDFFRLFNSAGKRVFPGRMRTAYLRQGPCLTEVTFAGQTGGSMTHSATVSLARTDDLVRGTYQLRLDVTEPVEFARFVVFQMGADSYSYTGERKMALGNEEGLAREWSTQWGGGTYRTERLPCTGRVPWISLHEAVSRAKQELKMLRKREAPGAWANRGLVIRAWAARLGGKPAGPWMAEYGVKARGQDTSVVDILPPPGVTRLEPGDFVEATFEHLTVPQFAADYYGPNESLRNALKQWQDTWRMIHREAVRNDRKVEVLSGNLEGLYPAIRIRAIRSEAKFRLSGGLGYVPVTVTGLDSWKACTLFVDGQPLDQSIHGNDFWQTDFDPTTQEWSRTFNVPVADDKPRIFYFQAAPK
jgi:hypothetical protein